MNFASPVAVTSRETSHPWSRLRVTTQLLVFAASLLLVPLLVRNAARRRSRWSTTTPGDPHQLAGEPFCSLQEAIYATEFDADVALDQTDPDDTYFSGCADPSGNWNTITLQNVTYQFNQSWDGDAHNAFGSTVTPIIFKAITIQGNGATLQWTGAGYARLFAVGQASITPTSGVVTGGTYSGTGNLTLQHVYVKDFKIKGGDGSCGGGGGMGAGGQSTLAKLEGASPR